MALSWDVCAAVLIAVLYSADAAALSTDGQIVRAERVSPELGAEVPLA